MKAISGRTFDQGETAGNCVWNKIDINNPGRRKTAEGKGSQQQKERPVHHQKLDTFGQGI